MIYVCQFRKPPLQTWQPSFWGLTTEAWGLTTGTRPPAPVPRTGQTSTVPINPALGGSDGNLQKGVAWPSPRFTDNGNGTVTDNLTGLIWLKNANCFGIKKWSDALSACNTLVSGQCGLTDGSSAGSWRLPNRFELESLLDLAYSTPTLSNAAGTAKWSDGDAFTGVQSGYFYWSSTTIAGLTDYAWNVNLDVGYVDDGAKMLEPYYVWPVRSGQ